MVWTMRNKRDVAKFTIVLTAIVLVGVALRVHFGYPEDMQSKVMPTALMTSVLLAVPLSFGSGLLAMRNNQLAERLQEMLEKDTLTRTATRAHFFGRMQAMPERPGVTLMIDIDRFKSINDTYGHFVGDDVLRRVGQVLMDHVRGTDIVARFGGEEFVIFLPERNLDTGFMVAERIRAAVHSHVIETDNAEVSVSVSIGGALKSSGEQIETAMKRADAALYDAKGSGRNMTIFDGAQRPAQVH